MIFTIYIYYKITWVPSTDIEKLKLNLKWNQYQVHLKRILHLDLKPENFIEVLESHVLWRILYLCLNVVIYKVEGVLKLIDFGLAKKLSDVEDTLRSSFPSIMSPGSLPQVFHHSAGYFEVCMSWKLPEIRQRWWAVNFQMIAQVYRPEIITDPFYPVMKATLKHTWYLSRTPRTLSVEQIFSCGAILLRMKISACFVEEKCSTLKAIWLHMHFFLVMWRKIAPCDKQFCSTLCVSS